MKQKLLTDIELDVQELKCLMDSYSKEPTWTLSELLKRNILQMQGRLEQLLQEVETVKESSSSSSVVEEQKCSITEEIIAGTVFASLVEEAPVVEPFEPAVIEQTESSLEEQPKHSVEEKPEPAVEEKPEISIVESPSVVETSKPVIVENMVVEKMEVPSMEESESPVTEAEFKSSVLGESIKLSSNLRHSISLNDSFRFSREIFGGDPELMNRVIEQISVMSSYKTAVAFLASKVSVNEENEAMADFLELLKKYFNQSA